MGEIQNKTEDRLIDFAINVSGLIKKIPKDLHGNYIASQLIRSSNSGALNYGEARGAESTADFIHKMKIVLKELRESYISLKIIGKCNWITDASLSQCLTECNELISIFVKSIKTVERNRISQKTGDTIQRR